MTSLNDLKQLKDGYEEKLSSTKRQIEKLELEQFQAQGKPYRELAELSHQVLCNYQHDDQCSWGYEEDCIDSNKTWNCANHDRYLKAVMKAVSLEEVPAMLLYLQELCKQRSMYLKQSAFLLTIKRAV